MLNVFRLEVYYEDTDFSGVVYHANYFKFIERARSTVISELGIDQLNLRKENKIFVVRSVSGRFIAPAFFGDPLEIKTDLLKVGGASIQLEQKVCKADVCIFVANVKLGLVLDGRPIRLPQEMKEALSNRIEIGEK